MIDFVSVLKLLLINNAVFKKARDSFQLSLTCIELHSHGYVLVPLSWADTNVASFNDRVQVMINNCIHVCVSLKKLSEIENL